MREIKKIQLSVLISSMSKKIFILTYFNLNFYSDKFVIFAGTETNIQILDLSTLQIRIKYDLKNVKLNLITIQKIFNC